MQLKVKNNKKIKTNEVKTFQEQEKERNRKYMAVR